MHVGARPRPTDRVGVDVALQVDHLQTSHLADRLTTCSLLNLSERRHPCHERLRIVEPILAIDPCAIVPLPAIEVESVDGQQMTLLDPALTLTSLLGFTRAYFIRARAQPGASRGSQRLRRRGRNPLYSQYLLEAGPDP